MARPNKRGPRTAAGKIRSSLNALRHGLAATHRRHALPMQAVERLAQAICDGHDGAFLAAARSIAENAFVLSVIRQQKIVVIERLKEATAIALRKGDNSFTLGQARFLEAWLAYREIQKLVPPALKKYEAQMLPPIPGVDWRDGTDDIVPIRLKALLEELTDEEEERARFAETKIEHLVLARPFGGQVGEASDTHTVREPAVDGRVDEIGREERKRDRHVNTLLDRGYGKPVAPVELGNAGEFDHLSDDVNRQREA